jgi:hypothetical protein
VSGQNGNGHLTLKRQWELMRAIEKGKRKGYWDQEAADTLGNYMLDNEIRRLTLRGYAAEISDAGLFVEEVSFKQYGIAAYLHMEYVRDGLGASPRQGTSSPRPPTACWRPRGPRSSAGTRPRTAPSPTACGSRSSDLLTALGD